MLDFLKSYPVRDERQADDKSCKKVFEILQMKPRIISNQPILLYLISNALETVNFYPSPNNLTEYNTAHRQQSIGVAYTHQSPESGTSRQVLKGEMY